MSYKALKSEKVGNPGTKVDKTCSCLILPKFNQVIWKYRAQIIKANIFGTVEKKQNNFEILFSNIFKKIVRENGLNL